MRPFCLLPLVALLAGCPTPPEAGPQGGNQPSNPGGPEGNNGPPGGPNSGPGNNGGPNNGPNSGGPGGEGANGPGGPPPEGAANGPGGPPPEGGGEGGPVGEGGPGGPPPEGGGEGANNGAAPGRPADQPAPPDISAPPVPEAGDPISGSILVQALEDDTFDPGGAQSQDQIKADEHVTFSGTVTCNGCTESLVLRAMPFVSPDQKPDSKVRYTTTTLSGPGAFSIAVPLGETALALELVVDADGNGVPSKGERLAVIELGGQLIPSQDRSGLDLDATDREFDAALPVNREGDPAGGAVEGG